ncbi:unnamed protein product [Symbiodinium pilosum]|uniref:Uncharacterized protein n=1 Tax=Symbiodinium pilosum TaxID=2952 RepID=A0A812QZT7_SYMPI|nr:unnamed protein product [Symbiodinium pilosum]
MQEDERWRAAKDQPDSDVRQRRWRVYLASPWRPARALVVLCFSGKLAGASGLVDCSRSPDCSVLRRQPCSERGSISNACGDCLPGTWGGPGPLNTVCLSKEACAVIYSGEDTCDYVPNNGMSVPFIFPFGRCVCDPGDGLLWPTAPGKCAQVSLRLANGLGQYEVQQCTSRTCAAGTCTPLAVWSPVLTQTVQNASFPCQTTGEDSIQLLDNCHDVTNKLSPSSLCGHAGFTATSTVFDALGDTPVDCELGPSCPASVLDRTRLAQSCCFGTLWSLKVDDAGQDTGEAAPGFCHMVWQAQTMAANDTNSSGESFSPTECMVKTAAPGWTGCACLDSRGYLEVGKTCTVKCEEPACRLPEGGIRPVPSAWVTSPVIPDLVPDHAALATSRAVPRICHCVWMLPILSFLVLLKGIP